MPDMISHTIDPVFDERSRILVLGSIPSPKSREQGFYYGHPHNRFWRVLAALFDEPVPRTIADKRDLLLRRRIALWDVIAACEIEGASDASIRNAVPNDLGPIFERADIRAVFCTGAKAGELYARLCPSAHDMPCILLPSTSPANAKASLEHLVEVYEKHLMPHLATDAEKRILPVADVVKLEQEIARRGTSLAELMERAGCALAYRAAAYFRSSYTSVHCIEEQKAPTRTGRFVLLCGNGNNGGDGWVAARELADEGHDVTVVCAVKPEDIVARPARDAALKSQAHLLECPNARISALPSRDELEKVLAQADVVIDAILGTGFEGASVRAPFDMWIEAANARRAHGALAVAADVPSGLSAQTGRAARPCMKADATVTMIASKPGLETPYAFAFCGTVHVAEISYIDSILDEWNQAERRTATETTVAPSAKPRAVDDGASAKPGSPNEEFIRPEAEDDDGYDPYSDRRPEPEPFFQQDPWS